ncbi:hypothetical protein BCR42DRAFT_414353 [Absidia repens]|uniref:Transmembrane protein n=1 Tax=Absidia repens TaxID=90262 RepID=A0A1X2IKG8_9FUNG|nr:hypothetical protein BCR42DRAFT_414353 [Absidia repens]
MMNNSLINNGTTLLIIGTLLLTVLVNNVNAAPIVDKRAGCINGSNGPPSPFCNGRH